MNTETTADSASNQPLGLGSSEGLGASDERDWLDSEEFYNAMQGYRCAPREDQRETVAHFENVKRLVRLRFGPDRCRYPECVDGNEDQRCPKWLTGECPGPRRALGGECLRLANATQSHLTADAAGRERVEVRHGESRGEAVGAAVGSYGDSWGRTGAFPWVFLGVDSGENERIGGNGLVPPAGIEAYRCDFQRGEFMGTLAP